MKIILLIFMVLCPIFAFAGNPHHHHGETVVNNTTVINQKSSSAIGIATAHAAQFDLSTGRWQMGVGLGSFDDSTAKVISFGKRLKPERVMLNGSIGREGGETSYGAGINWRFGK
jgi:hypothetical protein